MGNSEEFLSHNKIIKKQSFTKANVINTVNVSKRYLKRFKDENHGLYKPI